MSDFVKWQGELHEALAATNGFVSLEIIVASWIAKIHLWKQAMLILLVLFPVEIWIFSL